MGPVSFPADYSQAADLLINGDSVSFAIAAIFGRSQTLGHPFYSNFFGGYSIFCSCLLDATIHEVPRIARDRHYIYGARPPAVVTGSSRITGKYHELMRTVPAQPPINIDKCKPYLLTTFPGRNNDQSFLKLLVK